MKRKALAAAAVVLVGALVALATNLGRAPKPAPAPDHNAERYPGLRVDPNKR